MTIGGASPNIECVFPFEHRGKLHSKCPYDVKNEEFWCSTKVDFDGIHIGGQGLWGTCGPSCPLERI